MELARIHIFSCPSCGEPTKGLCLVCSYDERERLLQELFATCTDNQKRLFMEWRKADERFTNALILD